MIQFNVKSLEIQIHGMSCISMGNHKKEKFTGSDSIQWEITGKQNSQDVIQFNGKSQENKNSWDVMYFNGKSLERKIHWE